MNQVSVFFPSMRAAMAARGELRRKKMLGRRDTTTVYGEAPSDRRVTLRHTLASKGAIWGALGVAIAASCVGALVAPAIHMSVWAAALVGLPIGALYGVILGFVSLSSQPAHVPMQQGAGAVVVVDTHSLETAQHARQTLMNAPQALML